MNKLKPPVFFVLLCYAGMAFSQPGPVGQAQSLSHAIHAVDELDTTLAFYRDVFGINGNAQDFANAGVPLLTNAPGVSLRMSMVSLPGGVRFELTHFMGLERQSVLPQYTDPGAGSLILHVRDIDALVAAAKKANATIVTTGGSPIAIETPNGKARSIVLRDPDGFFLQLIEDAPSDSAADGNLYDVSLAYTIEDADDTRNFYQNMLGIELSESSSDFSRDATLARLIGAPETTEFRRLTTALPSNGTLLQFTEFRGVPRKKFDPRVRDPGAPALALQVSNLEGMVAQMKANGVNVLSTNGELVDFGGGTYTIFVEDPNGLNLEIFERQRN
jgi:catechol 2,3-dioxygenase-like lactoylglutathione lyase family enzyme